MPTVTEGIVNPYQGTSTLRQNVVDSIDAIDPRDVPLLAGKGWSMEAGAAVGADSLSKPCITQTYDWQNDELIPVSTTLRAAYTSGDAVLLVAASTAQYFQVDEIITISSTNGVTKHRVTARDLTADNLTVDLIGTDLAAGSTHASGVGVLSAGRPRPLGEQSPTVGRYTTMTTDRNFTQIFSDAVALTGTQSASEQVGVANRLDYETQKKIAELVIRLETALLYSPRVAALPGSNITPAARMGGLDWFIREADSSGQVRNAGGTSLASAGEGNLKDILDDTYSRGGRPDTILCGRFQRRQINSFLVPFVRTERSEGVAGVVVGQYEYTDGILNVLLDRYVRADHLFVITMEMIGIGPLRGNGQDRSFSWMELPKDGDYDRRFCLGEYTAEIRNRTRAHGMLRNLSTS